MILYPPCFTNGKYVEIGDYVAGLEGPVTSYTVSNNGWWTIYSDIDEIEGNKSVEEGDVLDAIDEHVHINDTVYIDNIYVNMIDTGDSDLGFSLYGIEKNKPLTVKKIKYDEDMNEYILYFDQLNSFCPALWVTHQKPYLDVNGQRIKINDIVYCTECNNKNLPWTVTAIKNGKITVKAGSLVMTDIDPVMFAHYISKTETDTQEKIYIDAQKSTISYWECGKFDCDECPCEVDGKNPYERYHVKKCAYAQTIDLLNRQRKLDARGK